VEEQREPDGRAVDLDQQAFEPGDVAKAVA
jgi:hypothetical protein